MKKTKIFAVILGIIFSLLTLLTVAILLEGDGTFTFNGKIIENKYWATAICVGIFFTIWGIFTIGAYISEMLYEALTDF